MRYRAVLRRWAFCPKLIALTRKTAAELAGVAQNPDPTLVRHIYDLHAMRAHVDHAAVTALAGDIAGADAVQFRNQYAAYAVNIAGETRKALDALRSDPRSTATATPASWPTWSMASGRNSTPLSPLS